jgi:hypothetical protein
MARVMVQARRLPRRSMAATQKRPLTRAFTAVRVTRIELAWPAWKVAVCVCTSATGGGEVCPRDVVNDRVSPGLMAR